MAWWVSHYYVSNGWLMADAHAYWVAGQAPHELYSRPPGSLDAFLYSPVFAQAMRLVAWLPWPAFAALWAAAETAAFLWLLRPLGWLRAGVLLLWCSPELALGNIQAWIAVATVIALTGRPYAWALPVLTKPSLAIGLVWHGARGEWRALRSAIGAVGAVVAVSFVLDPAAWREWIEFLVTSSSGVDLLLLTRLTLALGVVVFAARCGQSWLVPFGLMLALPHVGAVAVLTVLAAVPRLLRAHPVGRGRTADCAGVS